MGFTPRFRKTYVLVAVAGTAAALLTAVGGVLLERRRFGSDDRDAVARIERELVQQFDRSGEALAAIASTIANQRDLIRDAAADEAAARGLFDALERVAPPGTTTATGISVYSPAGEPLSWAGRVSDLPPERTQGPVALFVAPDALGLRLVRVQPVVEGGRGSAATRLGSVVVERLLGADRASPAANDTFLMPASIAPVSVRAAIGDAQRRSDYAFVIPSSDGQVLVEAEIAPADLADARARWRSQTVGWVLVVLTLTTLVCTAPLLEARRRARAAGPLLAATSALVAALLAARYLLRLATVRLVERDVAGQIDLLLWALLLGGTRLARPGPHRAPARRCAARAPAPRHAPRA